MKTLLHNARIKKGIKTRELARMSGIDPALISKFESAQRQPTRHQLKTLSTILDFDFDSALLLWLKDKILRSIEGEPLAVQALEAAIKELKPTAEDPLQKLIAEMDLLKNKFENLRGS